jgi:hypothetical protein
MRGIQPNLRASSSYVEPERMCGLHRRASAARRILVLVTSRRFPPPWTALAAVGLNEALIAVFDAKYH